MIAELIQCIENERNAVSLWLRPAEKELAPSRAATDQAIQAVKAEREMLKEALARGVAAHAVLASPYSDANVKHARELLEPMSASLLKVIKGENR